MECGVKSETDTHAPSLECGGWRVELRAKTYTRPVIADLFRNLPLGFHIHNDKSTHSWFCLFMRFPFL